MSHLKDLSPKEFENHLESQVFETVKKNQELFKEISDQSSQGTPDAQLLTAYKKSEDRLVFFLHARKDFSESFQQDPLVAYKRTFDLCVDTLGKSNEPLSQNLDLLEVLKSSVAQIFEAHDVSMPEDLQVSVQAVYPSSDETSDSNVVIIDDSVETQEWNDDLNKIIEENSSPMSELNFSTTLEIEVQDDNNYIFVEDTHELDGVDDLTQDANSDDIIKEIVGEIEEVHMIDTHVEHDLDDASTLDINEILATNEGMQTEDLVVMNNSDSLLSYDSQFDDNNEEVAGVTPKWGYNTEENELEDSMENFFNDSFQLDLTSETSEIQVQDDFDSDSAFGK